jgi:hypothetical protein
MGVELSFWLDLGGEAFAPESGVGFGVGSANALPLLCICAVFQYSP